MLSKQKLHKYYNALLAKDAAYKGVFFVGVKTTGVFCRPTCPALKPNFENYEFFETAELALLSSFRPCERCRPLSHPSQVPELVSKLVEAVEAHPEKLILYATWLDTPLKPMLAIGDKKVLYLLEFVDRRGLEREIERLHQKTRSAIVPGWTEPLRSIDRKLAEYFKGALTHFETPINMLGSAFQKQVWEELLKIPPGATQTYTDIARSIGRPSAVRAVANANGANQLAIIIPCHRVINLNGQLGGYGGGVLRKQWLLNLERAFNRDSTIVT